MSKLSFVFSWNDESTGSWSGTPRGLFDGLNKKVEIRKLNVGLKQNKFIQKIITSFFPTINYSYAKKIINNNTNPNDNEPYFVFGEYNSKVANQSFCYQDFSIAFLIRQLQNQSNNYSLLRKFKNAVYLHSLKCKQKEAEKFYNNCAGIFTMSDWLKRDMVNNMGIPESKVHHVGGGCNVDASLVDASKKTGNKFLFIGTSWVHKNGELVVQAFEKLLQMHPELDLELYIAGPISPPPSVINKKYIHFLGRLPFDEVVRYYNLCDYFVMPSNLEAYGLVFAEALIFGLPCIGKNCYAMPEFINDGENGYLIQDNDVNQLTEAMEKLLVNGKTITEYVKSQHDFYVNKYSWDSVATRILSVIREQGFELNNKDNQL